MTTKKVNLKDVPQISKKRLEELSALAEGDIDYSDIPEIKVDEWLAIKPESAKRPKEASKRDLREVLGDTDS